MSSIYSTEEEFLSIAKNLVAYLALPFTKDSIPGTLLENVIATVKKGEVLNTYDFVDVMNSSDKTGWQVKSTKSTTPVTWKRAKLADSDRLIRNSKKNKNNLQNLGNSIIRFCNNHVKESFDKYQLETIGFARLIVFPDGKLKYYERELCSKENPNVFHEAEFYWKWAKQKKSTKKEQLPALQGIHKQTNQKWFAWHGLGENQLHFVGEKNWWPIKSENSIDFDSPKEKLSQAQFLELLQTTVTTYE